MIASLDIGTIKYMSFDRMLELWLKTMQNGCPAIKAHSSIMCDPPDTKSFPTSDVDSSSLQVNSQLKSLVRLLDSRYTGTNLSNLVELS